MEHSKTSLPTQRPGLLLALICLPVFIGALDLTIVSAVLPNVLLDLRLPFQEAADEAAWVVSGYLLAYTISVAVMGRISDMVGRRRTYLVSLLIFVLGSWLVASATLAPAAWLRTLYRLITGMRPDSAYMALYALIFGRVVQALGAGAMVPVSMALVGDLYPPERRALPLGIVGAVDTAGWVLGHLYGGVMVQVVAWPVLFWINIPITTLIAFLTWRQLGSVAERHQEGGLSRPALGAILVGVGVINALAALDVARLAVPDMLNSLVNRLLGLRWLTLLLIVVMVAAVWLTLIASRHRKEMARPDWPGTLLITLALMGLNLGLGGGGENQAAAVISGSPFHIIMLVVAALALGAFILVEQRSAKPLFALSHFRDRNITLANGINLLVGFCLMVGLVSVPLFVNAVIAKTADEGALVSGLLLGTLTIPMALASIPGGILTGRWGYRVPTAAGLALAAVGFYLGRTWTPDVSQVTMGLHMALAGVGLGLTVAPIGTAVINVVSADERGIASGLVLIMRLIGMTVGTSIMTNYGLRRSTALAEQLVSRLENPFDANALLQVSHEVATRIISEMLAIAAVVCLVAVLPALFFRARDAQLPA